MEPLTIILELVDRFSNDASEFFFDDEVISKKKTIDLIKRAYKLGQTSLKLNKDQLFKIYNYEEEFAKLKAEDLEKTKELIRKKHSNMKEAEENYQQILEELDIEDPYSYEYSE